MIGRISFTPRYSKKRTQPREVAGWQFLYRDDNGKVRKLTQAQYPELKDIATEQQARDFCNKLNHKRDEVEKKAKAQANAALRTRRFDFPAAISAHTERQRSENKSFLTCKLHIETLASYLIHERSHAHPGEFTVTSYKLALTRLREKQSLALATIKKMRESFNKWLSFCVEKGLLDQATLIPKSVLQDVARSITHTHTEAVVLGSGSKRERRKPKQVKALSHEQLCQLVDWATTHPDQADPLVAKLFYIAALVAQRRGAYLAVRVEDIETDAEGTQWLYFRETLQSYHTEVGTVWKVGEPDPLKKPKEKVPLWTPRLKQYVGEWAARAAELGSEWLFPDPYGWTPVSGGPKAQPGALPYYPDRLGRLLKTYLKAAGLPLLPLKNLRHSGANIVAKELNDPGMARDLLAHTSQRTTSRHYLDETDLAPLLAAGKRLAQ